jgi:hypothetical protein
MAFSVVLASGTTFVNGVTQLNATNLNAAVNAATFTTTAANSFIAFNGTTPIDGAFGTSLSWSGGTLNTIQDIRTTASPTFTGLSISGNLVLNNNLLQINASQPKVSIADTQGGGATWEIRNGVAAAGTFSIVENGVSNWLTIVKTTGLATFTGALVATGGLNSTSIGATTPSTGAFTTISATGATTLTTISGSDTTDSSSSTTGAFKTAGGLGVAKTMYAGNVYTTGTLSAYKTGGSELGVSFYHDGTAGRIAALNTGGIVEGFSVVLQTGVNRYVSGPRFYADAGDTSGPSFRAPHGVAPTSPTNGDIWTTTSGMFVRINGVTKSVNLT